MSETAKVEFEARGGYLYARCFGPFDVPTHLELLRAVNDEAVRRGSRHALVDMTPMIGELDLPSRFYIGDAVSLFWDRRIRYAALGRPDQLDRDHFAAKVAISRGVTTRVFSDFEEAVAWLLTGEAE